MRRTISSGFTLGVPIAYIPQTLAFARTYAWQTTNVHHKSLDLETIQVCNRFLTTYSLDRIVGGCNAENGISSLRQ